MSSPTEANQSFDAILQLENTFIDKVRTATDGVVNPARVGLALSGGGIRSAAFQVGILQGLATAGLLHHVDYLSSVSGGGYIAGWLIKWIKCESPKTVFEALKVQPGKVGPVRLQWLRKRTHYLTAYRLISP